MRSRERSPAYNFFVKKFLPNLGLGIVCTVLSPGMALFRLLADEGPQRGGVG